jgi:1L-myo-inositol 1-phosphate cytidylyltransferase / CDP-L-myo-inositol myo-inositolphosphotransferase
MALDFSGGSVQSLPGSRVLVWCERASWRVAGLELWRRAVYTACRAGFARMLIVADGGADAIRADLGGDPHLDGVEWEALSAGDEWLKHVAEHGGRWVVLSDRWVVDPSHLRDLAGLRGEAAAASPRGPLSADAADVAALGAAGWKPSRLPPQPVRSLPAPELYVSVNTPAEVSAAEDALFQSLARNTTNVFSRYVDRAMSRAISRLLAPYSVTPNQITIFSIALGIVGALCLLRPTYFFGLLGSFLFLASTVIDGCDGEIARVKFQESAEGARLDVIGDNVVHAFLFPCVAVHAYRTHPDGPYLWLGLIAFAGVIVTWLAVYLVIVRHSPSPRAQAVFEMFGNREFAYLFFFLGLIGKLQWFVWCMAFGLWAFPLALFAIYLRDR